MKIDQLLQKLEGGTHGQHVYSLSLGHTRTACLLSFLGTHTDSMLTLFPWDTHGQHAYFLSFRKESLRVASQPSPNTVRISDASQISE
jgi:hypothetical protein